MSNISNIIEIIVDDNKKIANIYLSNDEITEEVNNIKKQYIKKKYMVGIVLSGTEDCKNTLENLILSQI